MMEPSYVVLCCLVSYVLGFLTLAIVQFVNLLKEGVELQEEIAKLEKERIELVKESAAE